MSYQDSTYNSKILLGPSSKGDKHVQCQSMGQQKMMKSFPRIRAEDAGDQLCPPNLRWIRLQDSETSRAECTKVAQVFPNLSFSLFIGLFTAPIRGTAPKGSATQSWSAANGGLRDGGLSKSEDIRGKRPFSSVFWISQVLFVPSGKGRKRQKKGEKGRFRPISGKGGQTPLKPPFVTPPFAAAQQSGPFLEKVRCTPRGS